MAKKKAPGHQADKVGEIEAYGRVEVWLRVVDWGGRILFVLALAVCMKMAEPVIADLAGKKTTVDLVAQLGWGAALASSAGWAQSSRRRKLAESRIPADGRTGRRVRSESRAEEVIA